MTLKRLAVPFSETPFQPGQKLCQMIQIQLTCTKCFIGNGPVLDTILYFLPIKVKTFTISTSLNSYLCQRSLKSSTLNKKTILVR